MRVPPSPTPPTIPCSQHRFFPPSYDPWCDPSSVPPTQPTDDRSSHPRSEKSKGKGKKRSHDPRTHVHTPHLPDHVSLPTTEKIPRRRSTPRSPRGRRGRGSAAAGMGDGVGARCAIGGGAGCLVVMHPRIHQVSQAATSFDIETSAGRERDRSGRSTLPWACCPPLLEGIMVEVDLGRWAGPRRETATKWY